MIQESPPVCIASCIIQDLCMIQDGSWPVRTVRPESDARSASEAETDAATTRSRNGYGYLAVTAAASAWPPLRHRVRADTESERAGADYSARRASSDRSARSCGSLLASRA